jgi:hypothetical protein
MCFLSGIERIKDPMEVQSARIRLGIDLIASPINVRNANMLIVIVAMMDRFFTINTFVLFFFIGLQ